MKEHNEHKCIQIWLFFNSINYFDITCYFNSIDVCELIIENCDKLCPVLLLSNVQSLFLVVVLCVTIDALEKKILYDLFVVG